MNLTRREWIEMLMAAAGGYGLAGCTPKAKQSAGGSSPRSQASSTEDPYTVPEFGNVTFMHFTDCHAQLLPVYFREPSVNLGVGEAKGRPPHLVGKDFLKHFGIKGGGAEAHALTYIDFEEAARRYGKVGGFAHFATLIKNVRSQREGRSLLLDGGDTWQGSGTALWSNGQDMVDACKKLGVDVMTGHWEFTYGAERVKEIVDNDLKGSIDFVAQNVFDAEWGDERVFKPYVIKEVNKIPVAVIGQAFPYTPVANPAFLFPNWSFGIREEEMQAVVDEARSKGAQVVVVLSHNGMDVDLKMASRVRGIDAILGGHTHDAMPAPSIVENPGGKTLVINSGSNAKFLSVLDFDVKDGKVADFRFRLLPVFSNLLPADAEMAAFIDEVRKPHLEKLNEKLAVTESVLYRRGNFNGTFDQVIVDAMMKEMDAPIAFSPGFRWGVSLLPGDPITMDALLTQTATTYSGATLTPFKGEMVKAILEDVADNLFHPDPYFQQGGDMVRVGGMNYTIDLNAKIGSRLSDITVGGKPLDPNKSYNVAGWASVQPSDEERTPIWEIVAKHLRSVGTVKVEAPTEPKIKGA